MARAAAPTYADAEYQAAHDETFSHPLTQGIDVVLPPGVGHDDLGHALEDLVRAVGDHAVFSGQGLRDYVDPYEIPESVDQKKIPCAAVWYVACARLIPVDPGGERRSNIPSADLAHPR